jgi:hypothetical protein
MIFRRKKRITAPDGPPLGGLPWEPRTDDVGVRIVDQVGYAFTLDKDWSLRDERGLRWWGRELVQTVRSEPGFDDDGFELFRVHAQTDVLRDFEATPANLSILNAIAPFATTSCYLVDDESGTVKLAASMFAHEQTEPWITPMFKNVAAMQVADAHARAGDLAEATGSSIAGTAHPDSGHRRDADDMLNVLDLVTAFGSQEPPWRGNELLWAKSQLDQSRYTVLATGGPDGLTAELPFHDATSLLTIQTGSPNPQLGHGLLMILRLAPTVDEQDGGPMAAELNRAELRQRMFAHHVGSWCWVDGTLDYVTFLPNFAYTGQDSDVINFVMSMVRRARWFAETFYGDDWDANLGDDGRTTAKPSILRGEWAADNRSDADDPV